MLYFFILGEPYEMGEEEEGEKQASFSSGKQPKHLFRDAENRIIGGVGAGLGAYLNTDP